MEHFPVLPCSGNQWILLSLSLLIAFLCSLIVNIFISMFANVFFYFLWIFFLANFSLFSSGICMWLCLYFYLLQPCLCACLLAAYRSCAVCTNFSSATIFFGTTCLFCFEFPSEFVCLLLHIALAWVALFWSWTARFVCCWLVYLFVCFVMSSFSSWFDFLLQFQ